MKSSQRGALIGTAVVLTGLAALLQRNLDRPDMRRQPGIEPPALGKGVGQIGNSGAALPFEYSLAAVSGFRQVVAGLLWVRADSFFHQGNYDAILPLVRIITWMDPNFLDVYSTGAWHMMYNFTDEGQRSDRRYLPAGIALLNEGIKANPDVYDMYFDAGWNNFDKIKNYDEAVRYYQDALKTRNPDYTRVGHGLAHALERSGRIDASIAQWEKVLADHKRVLADPKSDADRKNRAQTGIQSASKNLNIMKIRRVRRADDTKNPVDAQFSAKVVRIKPRVLEISGEWNLVGAKNFDEGLWGPVDGARVNARLHDYGYRMPAPQEFSFEVDKSLTIMQDDLSVRGGKQIKKGSLFIVSPGDFAVTTPPDADKQGMYSLASKEMPAGLGVPLQQALAGRAPLSAEGKRQLAALQAQGKTIDAMVKEGYHVAVKDYFTRGKFKREIDMSKDPKMYSFSKDRYELILSFNPRTAPEFVQDRYGWSGEGLTDKRYLDTTTVPGLRMLRLPIVLTREDIVGEGRAVIWPRNTKS